MNAPAPVLNDYLERILNARVYDVAVETPLDPAPGLSARTGNTVLLKREDMQPVFSFKLRGAYNRMAQLTPAELKRGVIAASAGNHALALSWHGSQLRDPLGVVGGALTTEAAADPSLRYRARPAAEQPDTLICR